MVELARQPATTRTVVADIARRQNIPAFYLAKIVPLLARAGLLHTSLGAAGGICLAAPADEISLYEIIEAIEGPWALNLCSIDPARCDQHVGCTACTAWGEIQARLDESLKMIRLSDLTPMRTAARSQRQDSC